MGEVTKLILRDSLSFSFISPNSGLLAEENIPQLAHRMENVGSSLKELADSLD